MVRALDILPPPKLVEEVSTKAILDRRIAIFLEVYREAAGKDFGALTESSPIVRALRSAAEDETVMRQRINERYRARFVYFASGDNLELLLEDEGLQPIEGETEARRQERIILNRTGSSAAGPLEWYRRKAIEVAPDEIADISVDFPGGSVVRVAILAKTLDGIPSDDLVARVRDRLTSDEVHPDDHTEIEVLGAEPVPVVVRARITLEPDTDPQVFAALEPRYRGAFAEHIGLGRDVPWSWSSSRLQVPGVHKVKMLGDEPPAVLPYQVAYLQDLILELAQTRGW